jgi:hypothetical protein
VASPASTSRAVARRAPAPGQAVAGEAAPGPERAAAEEEADCEGRGDVGRGGAAAGRARQPGHERRERGGGDSSPRAISTVIAWRIGA